MICLIRMVIFDESFFRARLYSPNEALISLAVKLQHYEIEHVIIESY